MDFAATITYGNGQPGIMRAKPLGSIT
ncbi:hypothetical protein CGLO_14704 [Colletotrichum gloeosporioides Cg-14]|uniref:Uncharacterized protein n=1 Tax=Colletotrichum gloeosporioides (strain Cg-14) TaxID=1237896 RepID=T0LD54_COLGC|nr:hypothetical protein CGLO_14704 [Colletotrichum gloeosporioides Cg-14]